MIRRLTSCELRELTFQLDGINAIIEHGGQTPRADTVLTVNKVPKAFLFWHEDGQKCMTEFLDFVPGNGPFRDFFGNEFVCIDGVWDIK